MKSEPREPASDSGGLSPAALAMLRCPATGERLREVTRADGVRALLNESGTREYAMVRGIYTLVERSGRDEKPAGGAG